MARTKSGRGWILAAIALAAIIAIMASKPAAAAEPGMTAEKQTTVTATGGSGGCLCGG